MENLLDIVVHVANINDTKAGILVAKLSYERYASIQKFCADTTYCRTFVLKIREILSLDVGISKKLTPISGRNSIGGV